ncbi:MAG: phosphoribosylglycinamide formyltransferase [Burkholderiaceae bacterium]
MRRIVVLASGRGSNLDALLTAAAAEHWDDQMQARVSAVISNQADARALEVARAHGVATHIVSHQTFDSRAAFEHALADTVDRDQPALVVLAGFMRILGPEFVQRYAGRLINIHPSLLPSFPGLNTHQRALDAGVRIHGATVHFVSSDVDAGAIIAQAAVPVNPDDDEAVLAARVLQQEHLLLPRAVRHVLEGRVRCRGRRAVLHNVAPGQLSLLAG